MNSNLDIIAEIVADLTGLHFPNNRRNDLERNLNSAAIGFGFQGIEQFSEWMKNNIFTREQVESLADYLTIGETYFFRDSRCFNILRSYILRLIMEKRSAGGKNIRIWSAGCSTGEEPYTIAIVLHETIKDISDWNITILATDLNRRFLKKAVDGIYTDWSFRDTGPEFKQRYFRSAGKGSYELIPEIRRMVKFSILNLADNIYPSVINNTNSMDVVFCRNVLMYFTAGKAAGAVNRLYNSISDNGFLIVSPSETSTRLFSRFETVNINNMIFYRKSIIPMVNHYSDNLRYPEDEPHTVSTGYDYQPGAAPVTGNGLSGNDFRLIEDEKKAEVVAVIPDPEEEADPMSEALSFFESGNYDETIKLVLSYMQPGNEDARDMALLARAYANLGSLAEARKWCERAVNTEKLNAGYYHLLAVILLEGDETELAESTLQKALYVDQDYVMAHFTLGNLTKSQGRMKEARRHFNNALLILSGYKPEDILQGTDGMTAGNLYEIIKLLI